MIVGVRPLPLMQRFVMDTRIKIFEYVEHMDEFITTTAYQALADERGLIEWHAVVWIG